jgi:Peptidase A4 family
MRSSAIRWGLVAAAAVAVGAAATAVQSPSSSTATGFGRMAMKEETAGDVTSNWAGYVALGPGSTSSTASSAMSYTDVTGQWIQPKATCTVGDGTSAAIWVGLGGYSEASQALEQTGTEADCNANGQPEYYAWYELVPAYPVNLKLKINAGDVIQSSVVATGTHILVQVIDRTRAVRFTKTLTMASPDLTSAEWIAEAPSECGNNGFCRELALTNFGSVSFTGTYARGNGLGGTITSPNWTSAPIQLVPDSHHRVFGYSDGSSDQSAAGAGASPTDLAADGTGFTVDWLAKPTASQ